MTGSSRLTGSTLLGWMGPVSQADRRLRIVSRRSLGTEACPLRSGLAVTDGDTAIALGSGSVAVLGTPRVVALVEEASVKALEGRLEAGTTSVGMRVQLDHLAPTAVGHKVRAEATLKEIEGRRLTFAVSVHDERGSSPPAR